jgi:hypothetical protein
VGLSPAYLLLLLLADPLQWVETAIPDLAVRHGQEEDDADAKALLESVVKRIIDHIAREMPEGPSTVPQQRLLALLALLAWVETGVASLTSLLTLSDGSPTQAHVSTLEVASEQLRLRGTPDAARRVRDAYARRSTTQRPLAPTTGEPPKTTIGRIVEIIWTAAYGRVVGGQPDRDFEIRAFVQGCVAPAWRLMRLYQETAGTSVHAHGLLPTYDPRLLAAQAMLSDEQFMAMYTSHMGTDGTPEGVRFRELVHHQRAVLRDIFAADGAINAMQRVQVAILDVTVVSAMSVL